MCKSKTGHTIAVNSGQLELLVSACGEQINMEVTPTHLVIQSGTLKSSLPIQDAKDFPAFPSLEKLSPVACHLRDLAKAIRSVAWCASDEEGRDNLRCVHVVLKPKSMLVEATTGRQLAFSRIASICEERELLIPSDDAILVASHLENASEFLVSENALAVKSDNGVLWSKLMEPIFPKVPDIYDTKLECVATLNTKELSDFCAMALALPLKNPTNGAEIVMTTDFGACKVEVANTDQPTSREFGGGEVAHRFNVNPKYLINALRACETETVEIFRNAEGSTQMGFGRSMFLKSGDLTVATGQLTRT